MRKSLVILFLILCIGCRACAGPLPAAAVPDAHEQFERYQSFNIDKTTGEWSAHTLIAGQLLSAVAQGEANGYMSGGVCILYPGVRGNRDLSLLEPVLYVQRHIFPNVLRKSLNRISRTISAMNASNFLENICLIVI